jgi:hypothetical protein
MDNSAKFSTWSYINTGMKGNDNTNLQTNKIT